MEPYQPKDNLDKVIINVVDKLHILEQGDTSPGGNKRPLLYWSRPFEDAGGNPSAACFVFSGWNDSLLRLLGTQYDLEVAAGGGADRSSSAAAGANNRRGKANAGAAAPRGRGRGRGKRGKAGGNHDGCVPVVTEKIRAEIERVYFDCPGGYDEDEDNFPPPPPPDTPRRPRQAGGRGRGRGRGRRGRKQNARVVVEETVEEKEEYSTAREATTVIGPKQKKEAAAARKTTEVKITITDSCNDGGKQGRVEVEVNGKRKPRKIRQAKDEKQEDNKKKVEAVEVVEKEDIGRDLEEKEELVEKVVEREDAVGRDLEEKKVLVEKVAEREDEEKEEVVERTVEIKETERTEVHEDAEGREHQKMTEVVKEEKEEEVVEEEVQEEDRMEEATVKEYLMQRQHTAEESERLQGIFREAEENAFLVIERAGNFYTNRENVAVPAEGRERGRSYWGGGGQDGPGEDDPVVLSGQRFEIFIKRVNRYIYLDAEEQAKVSLPPTPWVLLSHGDEDATLVQEEDQAGSSSRSFSRTYRPIRSISKHGNKRKSEGPA